MPTPQQKRAYGRTYHAAIRAGLDPATARSRAQRAQRGDAIEALPKRASKRPRYLPHRVEAAPEPPAGVERREGERTTVTAAFFGDPLPGCSYLERLSPAARARLL